MPPGIVTPPITASPPMPRPLRRASVSTPSSFEGLLPLKTLRVSTCVASSTRTFGSRGGCDVELQVEGGAVRAAEEEARGAEQADAQLHAVVGVLGDLRRQAGRDARQHVLACAHGEAERRVVERYRPDFVLLRTALQR